MCPHQTYLPLPMAPRTVLWALRDQCALHIIPWAHAHAYALSPLPPFQCFCPRPPMAPRTVLRELRDHQSLVKMMDESAEEIVKEYMRKHVETRLNRALELLKGPGAWW